MSLTEFINHSLYRKSETSILFRTVNGFVATSMVEAAVGFSTTTEHKNARSFVASLMIYSMTAMKKAFLLSLLYLNVPPLSPHLLKMDAT